MVHEWYIAVKKAVLDHELLSLQRELLLEKLKNIDKQMSSASIKKNKGYTLMFVNGKFHVMESFMSGILTPKQVNTSP
ncbi:hypothetical protein AGMMS50268_29630 [Spirochaetia bacterium]|nr:hypothetical protein AGMMS50268_29630 [Spirochaetia bacterium]